MNLFWVWDVWALGVALGVTRETHLGGQGTQNGHGGSVSERCGAGVVGGVARAGVSRNGL